MTYLRLGPLLFYPALSDIILLALPVAPPLDPPHGPAAATPGKRVRERRDTIIAGFADEGCVLYSAIPCQSTNSEGIDKRT